MGNDASTHVTSTMTVDSPRQQTEETLRRLLKSYGRDKRAISVNFRKLVQNGEYPDHATHLIHPYPAKLLPHIPRFFLSNDLLSRPGDLILDPFCGSGTVLLEAVLSSRRAVGADANPLARLISSTKITPVRQSVLRKAVDRVLRSAKGSSTSTAPDVVNLNYWFYPHVIRQLSALQRAIARVRDRPTRDFLFVCFSVCVRRVSRADPRLSVPVRLNGDEYHSSHRFHRATRQRLRRLKRMNVFKVFQAIADANISRLLRLNGTRLPATRTFVATDARDLAFPTARGGVRKLRQNTVRLAITSPPYAGAQKYVRATSLSLGWLELCPPSRLRAAERECIGREHYPKIEYKEAVEPCVPAAARRLRHVRHENPLRAHIASVYLNEMSQAIRELWRVIKPGGHVVFVAGDNHVKGRPFRTSKYLQQIFEDTGFTTKLRLIDAIHSRGLMTKRNKTASVITREWVFLFQKPQRTR